MLAIVNGQGFGDWCSSKGWKSGMEEMNKRSYRISRRLKLHLEQSKSDNQHLQQEILQLKRELKRERKRNENKKKKKDTI